jgi:N-acetylglucosaminyldiphosphoundecaprenol N-acetyl-beta-D-mannosaminyltransferase
MNRVPLLNGQFDPLTLPQTVDEVFRFLDSGKHGWLCTVNVAILMMMRSNPRLQRFVDNAALIVADGQPLVWCSPWLGERIPVRVTSVDLVDAICDRAALLGKRVYLLGATQSVVSTLAQRLRERHKGLQIAFSDGYFSPQESRARAEMIRSSGADILLVGMGVPRQEIFLEEELEHSGASIGIGVGGSFDVLAGLRKRAPLWVQNLGFEWLYRLVQEPRRLFARYFVTNCQFIWLLLFALMARR